MSGVNLPNLLIIGAAKSGTTSLHRYLSLHPDVFMSKQKELRYFVPAERKGRLDRGVDWYTAQFPEDAAIRGETSPQYTLFPKIAGVPETIKRTLGRPKLIYLLRDPVERILSDYVQIVDENYHLETFKEMLTGITTTESYWYSRYYLQLSRYLEVFPREDILVVINERLSADPQGVMRTVFEFLGVDPDFWTDEFEQSHNAYKPGKYIAPWFDGYAPEFLKQQLRDPVLRSRSWRMYRALHWLSRVGGDLVEKPLLDEDEDAYLTSLFQEDVTSLRNLLDDPIPEWRHYAS